MDTYPHELSDQKEMQANAMHCYYDAVLVACSLDNSATMFFLYEHAVCDDGGSRHCPLCVNSPPASHSLGT